MVQNRERQPHNQLRLFVHFISRFRNPKDIIDISAIYPEIIRAPAPHHACRMLYPAPACCRPCFRRGTSAIFGHLSNLPDVDAAKHLIYNMKLLIAPHHVYAPFSGIME